MRRAAAVVVLALVLAPAVARAQAKEPRVEPRDQVVLSGDVVVPRGTAVGQVVVFDGTATVGGVVHGDVVVFRGPVAISGQVGGDVVSLDGSIRLTGTAQVAGDVLAGGTIRAQPGAQVVGRLREGVRFTLAGPFGALGLLLAPAAVSVSVLLVMLLLLLFAPRGVERVSGAMRTAPFATAGWGLATALALPLVAVASAATILGLPFGLAIVLGLGLVWLVGLAWGTWAAGRLLVRAPRSRTAALFAGWGLGAAIGLVPVLNVVWWTLASIAGLGATIVAAWRVRGTSRHRVGAVPRELASSGPVPTAPSPVSARPSGDEPSAEPPATPLGED